MNQTAPSNQEAAFLDYVERVGKNRAGRAAVRVRLSNLSPGNRTSEHLRIAAATFEPLLRDRDGVLFKLFNDDMVVLCKGASLDEIDRSVVRLRYLFSEDPLLKNDTDGREPFCDQFDLEQNYPALLSLARSLVEARAGQKGPEGKQAGPAAPPKRARKPLDPSNLKAIQMAIAQADLSGLIRRQAVCAVAQGQKPQPVFFEIFTSIEALRQALMPETDIHASRWLFQDLTQYLDKRVIAYLSRNDDATLQRAFSLNLNVSTLLSPAFLDFDAALSSAIRRTIIIELGLMDVFADLGSFLFARNFLHERGYRFCLDGMTHLSLPLIERERLGFDLVKLFWSGDLKDQLQGSGGDELREAAKRVGQGQLILARCDSELALDVGQSLGISLYQGHLIDAMLKKETGGGRSAQDMAAAMSRHRAATRSGRQQA